MTAFWDMGKPCVVFIVQCKAFRLILNKHQISERKSIRKLLHWFLSGIMPTSHQSILLIYSIHPWKGKKMKKYLQIYKNESETLAKLIKRVSFSFKSGLQNFLPYNNHKKYFILENIIHDHLCLKPCTPWQRGFS